MDWRDEGVILTLRTHGESSAIVELFTPSHGRHLGVVRGATSRKMAPHLQVGGQVAVTWRARLEGHIGTFTAEPVRSRAAVLENPAALAALTSVCALLHLALPERDPHPQLYARSVALLDGLATGGADWIGPYIRWELVLLDEMGFGLDLGSCAVTGARDDLCFISPKTGRAVSRGGAGEWADRLLPLHPALLGQGPVTGADAVAALSVTAHFLTRALGEGQALPESRARLIARLAKL